jgi:DNA-binding LacI/PurR family transcriptional regulator
MSFLPGLQTELAEHDVLLVLHLVPDAHAATEVYNSWRRSRRVDGAIVINPTVADPRLPCLEKLRMPAVVVGDSRRVSTLPSIWTDDAHAVDLAVQHLTGLGHRRIARLGVRSDYLHSRVRSRAFNRAMQEAGLDPDLHGYSSESDTRLLARWLRLSEPPTAVIHEDVVSAVQTMMMLRERGVAVPQEVSIVGWDDPPWSATVSPALTTLRRDLYAYGRQVAAQLLKAVDGETVEHVQGTRTELIVRESTAAASGRAH